jgi:hypothetical protein
MFEKLGKLWTLQSYHHVPGVPPIKPANDNLRVGDHGARAMRPRLVCRWSWIEGTDRLACRWEFERSDEPSGLLRRDRPFHKTFFELSYQPKLSKPAGLINRVPPVGVRNARSVGSLPVLHAGHARMPSTDGKAVLPCCCERFAITLGGDLSAGGVSQRVG